MLTFPITNASLTWANRAVARNVLSLPIALTRPFSRRAPVIGSPIMTNSSRDAARWSLGANLNTTHPHGPRRVQKVGHVQPRRMRRNEPGLNFILFYIFGLIKGLLGYQPPTASVVPDGSVGRYLGSPDWTNRQDFLTRKGGGKGGGGYCSPTPRERKKEKGGAYCARRQLRADCSVLRMCVVRPGRTETRRTGSHEPRAHGVTEYEGTRHKTSTRTTPRPRRVAKLGRSVAAAGSNGRKGEGHNRHPFLDHRAGDGKAGRRRWRP
ncbi:hypothetical protein F5148DRAFT_190805 [Russula earlei]|uniref:Uncharacterized protein n=1 Tax=Russula earlei TaxID=71964 RepID=A0ACC0U5M2_9AGAM|nr:hypothetical protein F5148DRAFT_190805 [Russula earlei]